jgi:S-formylglutathione hydrolase FrmB
MGMKNEASKLACPGLHGADCDRPDVYRWWSVRCGRSIEYGPARDDHPLLVLLNGLAGSYASSAAGLIAALPPNFQAIVVMPEGGSGWYTDWWNGGERGGPAWESYELNEVIPAILTRYPILPQRQYHAIAGTSMGGLGAAYLGGRLPGFFGSVASLSGFVDPQYYAGITDPAMGITAFAPLHGDHEVYPVDGPPNGFYDVGHNPSQLTVNLTQTRVFESTGTGIPSNAGLAAGVGALGNVAVGSVLEGPIIYQMNRIYHSALVTTGVDVTYQVHSGGHDGPDFENEFKAMFAWGLFNAVASNPASWTNDTVATSGQLWDIGYRFAQPPNRVVQFQRSGDILSIGAAGSNVTITTSDHCVMTTPTPITLNVTMCQ